jgi:hypothetical protein
MRRPESEYPAAMVAEAARHPDGWVYEIEGRFDPDEAVPTAAIKGALEVGADGRLTGEYEPNPNFVTRR